MPCPKCQHELEQVNFTAYWCARCGTLVTGSRDKLRVRETRLRELLAVRLNRNEMSLMLERQIREYLYGAQRPKAPTVHDCSCSICQLQGSEDSHAG